MLDNCNDQEGLYLLITWRDYEQMCVIHINLYTSTYVLYPTIKTINKGKSHGGKRNTANNLHDDTDFVSCSW